MSEISGLRSGLSSLTDNLNTFREGLETAKKKPGRPSASSQEQDCEGKLHLSSLLHQFKDMIESMVEHLDKYEQTNNSVVDSKLEDRVTELESLSRMQGDNLDHHQQRSLKGKFFLKPSKSVHFSTPDELKADNLTLPEYVCRLVDSKFHIKQLPTDIKSCHFTNSGGIIFRYSNLSPGSSFDKVVYAIKKGHGRDNKNLFFNFALTPRRASLLYELRRAKRENKIEQFLSDSDGSLAFIRKADGPKVRLTSIFEKKSATLYSYSHQELMDLINKNP